MAKKGREIENRRTSPAISFTRAVFPEQVSPRYGLTLIHITKSIQEQIDWESTLRPTCSLISV